MKKKSYKSHQAKRLKVQAKLQTFSNELAKKGQHNMKSVAYPSFNLKIKKNILYYFFF